MGIRVPINPATRIHGMCRIEVEVDNGKIVDAWSTGLFFRGIEAIIRDRDPRDASLYLQRVCGICSVPHAIAAAYAVEKAYGIKTTRNGQLLRNIMTGADVLHNHLIHFYLLALADYVLFPGPPPLSPQNGSDYRLPPAVNAAMVQNYAASFTFIRKAHELLALWGAKAPHTQTVLTGGASVPPDGRRVAYSLSLVDQIEGFINTALVPDVERLGEYYPEYYSIGAGYGNLLSFGWLPKSEDNNGPRELTAGVIVDGAAQPFDPNEITEAVKYAWYNAPAEGETEPAPGKPGAYSWVKAPRYAGKAMECGPLARGWINGYYRRGISVMDRHMARALEAKRMCGMMRRWLGDLLPEQPVFAAFEPRREGEGSGFTDSMRGALLHAAVIRDYRIAHYEIITPSTWNMSPRDDAGARGAAEEALVGTPADSETAVLTAGRIVRSFDPCYSSAIHAVKVTRRGGRRAK